MNIKRKIRSVASQLVALTILVPTLSVILSQTASAGALGTTLVRFNRMNASQATTGTVCASASASGAGTEASVKVTFPTSYTLGLAATFTVDTATTTGWPATATAWPGVNTATNVTTQSVTFPSSDITDTTIHCFNWINSAAVQIKSSASNDNTGTVITQTSTPTAIDTGNYATASVAATCGTVGCDQILVSASVNASFSFSLSANVAALSTLSAGGPSAATAVNASVSTNATHGWQMWAADLGGTPGLVSTTASKTIAYTPAANGAVATLSTGVEGYNLGAGTAGTGTCNGATTDPKFASGGTSFRGGGLDGTFRSLAAATGVASGCQLPLTVNASVSATTPAATDYAGTMTVIAAGSF